MLDILNFLIEVGKLNRKERRGWIIHQIPNPETTSEHIFRLAILVLVLGRGKKLDLARMIKMALIHDLCEVYAKDLTPYDPLLPKDKKGIEKVLKHWPKFTLSMKKKKEREKSEAESTGLHRLISRLPKGLKSEIKSLWLEFLGGLTREGKFVRQADKLINLLQGMEYYKRYGRIKHQLWMRWIKEIVDEPTLVEFMREVEQKFCGKHKHH